MDRAENPRPVVGPDYLVAGRYRLRSRLGGGGMGTVWLAHDKQLNRDVALKQVATTSGQDIEDAVAIRERAVREGRIASRFDSAHSTTIYDVALDRGEPWLVMEYMPSCSLAQVLQMTGSLPDRQVAQIGAQIADALAEAHSEGVLHRDIKPGNILIANRGRIAGTVKLSDFGIARISGSVDESDASVITGTPAYFAPEVARGQDPTEASDVFSLGSTLYTAIEGQPPFGVDEDSISMLHKVARAEIIPPSCSGPIADALLRMLEPDPTRRPTIGAARDRLARIAAGDDGTAEQVLTSPLLAQDGRVPVWVRRAGTRRYAVPGNTVGGLRAIDQPTPLHQVRTPGSAGPSDARNASPPHRPRPHASTPASPAEAATRNGTDRLWGVIPVSGVASGVILIVALIIIAVVIALML